MIYETITEGFTGVVKIKGYWYIIPNDKGVGGGKL